MGDSVRKAAERGELFDKPSRPRAEFICLSVLHEKMNDKGKDRLEKLSNTEFKAAFEENAGEMKDAPQDGDRRFDPEFWEGLGLPQPDEFKNGEEPENPLEFKFDFDFQLEEDEYDVEECRVWIRPQHIQCLEHDLESNKLFIFVNNRPPMRIKEITVELQAYLNSVR